MDDHLKNSYQETADKMEHSVKPAQANQYRFITIIMPFFNGASTIDDVLLSLEKQNDKHLIKEIIFINDNSLDESKDKIAKYQERSSYKTRLINNGYNEGLAKNYNKGIAECSSDYFVLMHQDIMLRENDCYKKILAAFIDDNVAAVIPCLHHPYSVWRGYNFWQKCLFSRLVNKEIEKLTGKFDGFKKELIVKYGIFFDDSNYRTAGEDRDIEIRLLSRNFKVLRSGVNIDHIHNKNINFSLKDLINKETQLSECYGVLIRRHGFGDFIEFIFASFRPLLLILLFVPVFNLFGIILIIMYSLLYTKNVYIHEKKDPKIFLLPLVNIYLLFISAFYYIKGFVYGKQTI